ncbi:MAG TPA: hypothetical protein VFC56_12695 [Stellaceae bacterium]|nr:hypothetical protein [Stellaceae bacterium]
MNATRTKAIEELRRMVLDELREHEAAVYLFGSCATGEEWVMGADYTACDPYTLVFYGWGTRIGMPTGDLKSYIGFKNRMLQRPAVRTVLEREQSPLLRA